MDSPFEMIVAIVAISSATGVLMYWLKSRNGDQMEDSMEEDFFRMRDEIDRLNERVRRLESVSE